MSEFTILFTLAIMQLTGGYLEVMSSTIAPILLCVGIADSIHMISKYDDARLDGMNKRQSITEMVITLAAAPPSSPVSPRPLVSAH
ncbi:MAG: hypothetical protein U5K69_19290 [Balneolaceae bacterium]|nr:hypothetical protein [Balneolaceae bacterium]